MDWKPFRSDCVKFGRWNKDTQRMELVMDGGNVYSVAAPSSVYAGFFRKDIPSKGRYYNRVVKGRYVEEWLGKLVQPLPQRPDFDPANHVEFARYFENLGGKQAEAFFCGV